MYLLSIMTLTRKIRAKFVTYILSFVIYCNLKRSFVAKSLGNELKATADLRPAAKQGPLGQDLRLQVGCRLSHLRQVTIRTVNCAAGQSWQD